MDNMYDKWEEYTNPKHNDEIRASYFQGNLIGDILLEILIRDASLAIASLIAVFLYLRLMLGSWFLTAVGMFEIVMSLPMATVMYSHIFQIKYFPSINVLCLFIVLAIGADDIFVFMDSYKQSATHGEELLISMESRMSWVFRRAGSAMFLTSATTCSAFLATLISPIAETRCFGIYAACVIFFDYALVMALFCTAVVIYHDRFESKPYCCNCNCKKDSENSPTKIALTTHEGRKLDPISTFFKVSNPQNEVIFSFVSLPRLIMISKLAD